MIIQVCANLRVSVSARFGIATKQCNAATQTSKLSVDSIMNMCNYEFKNVSSSSPGEADPWQPSST